MMDSRARREEKRTSRRGLNARSAMAQQAMEKEVAAKLPHILLWRAR
jgi:hypothetical protein